MVSDGVGLLGGYLSSPSKNAVIGVVLGIHPAPGVNPYAITITKPLV
jgi:hypothetical protein